MTMAQSGEARRAAPRDSFLHRVGAMALELAVLGAVWWILGLSPPLAGAVAVVIVVSNLVPERVGTLTLGVLLLGRGGLVLCCFGGERVARVRALCGGWAAGAGGAALKRGEG